MPSPDPSTTSPTPHLPAPPSGASAADLVTSSDDPQELRELLDRARERLSFYESFDRIIGENIRRSGELMVETVTLREQAHTIASQAKKERDAFEAARQADRDHYRSLIQSAMDEVASMRPMVDGMTRRLQGVLDTLDADRANAVVPEEASSTTDTPVEAETVAMTTDLVEPWSTPAQPHDASTQGDTSPAVPADASPDVTPTPIPDEIPSEPESGGSSVGTSATDTAAAPGPRAIDVLAHGVPSAKIAISLQNMLRGLAVVTGVEAREFADGELRLTVTATDTLPVDALQIWLTDNRGDLTSTAETVTEMTFRES